MAGRSRVRDISPVSRTAITVCGVPVTLSQMVGALTAVSGH